MSIRIKMEIEFDFDPETGEYTQVSQKILGEKPTPKTTAKKVSNADAPETGVLLDTNKIILSNQAVELLGAQPEDRISISYEKKGRFFVPVIGIDEKKGNKLTKSNTISYRGKANDELVKYGTLFELEEYKNGMFYLKGENEIEAPAEKESKIKINVKEEDTSTDVSHPFDLKSDENSKQEITTTFNFNNLEL